MKKKIELLQYTENYLFDIDELIYKKIEASDYILKKVSAVSESSIFIYDYYHRKIIYLKPDKLFFTKKEIDECENKNLDLYLSKIIEADHQFLLKIQNKAFQFLKSQKKESIQNQTLHYNIKLDTSFKKNVLTNVRVKILETDKNGNLWIAMFVLKESTYIDYIIPFFRNDETNELNFFESDGLKAYNFNCKQLETINLLASGLNLEMIALKLQLKPNGLNTRLKSIYDILNVKSKSQALKIILKIVKL